MFRLVGFALSLVLGLTATAAVAQQAAAPAATTAAPAQPATVVPAVRNNNRHQQIKSKANQGNVDLVFIGDSITQGWENNGAATWAKNYAPRKALNAGISGDRTEHVLWRLDNGELDKISPRLAVLMIGTNNSGANKPEDIALGVKTIVERLRTKMPETKILVLAIFPRGQMPDDARRAVTSAANESIADLADDKIVYFLDIGDEFVEDDGSISKDIMPDFLHLSPKGYEIWAAAIEPSVVKLLGE